MVVCEFSIVPLGAGESVSQHVAACMEIVRASGLSHQLTAMGTLIEGDWDAVMEVVRACHAAVRARTRRVLTTVRIDDREAPPGRLQEKIRSVETKVRGPR